MLKRVLIFSRFDNVLQVKSLRKENDHRLIVPFFELAAVVRTTVVIFKVVVFLQQVQGPYEFKPVRSDSCLRFDLKVNAPQIQVV